MSAGDTPGLVTKTAHPGGMPEPITSASFQIFRILFNSVFLRKEPQFFDECHLSVMFFLRFDVTPDVIPVKSLWRRRIFKHTPNPAEPVAQWRPNFGLPSKKRAWRNGRSLEGASADKSGRPQYAHRA